MKPPLLVFIVLVATATGAWAQSPSSDEQAFHVDSHRPNSPNAESSASTPAFSITDKKSIHTYQDVLAALPSGLPHSVEKMTAVQREVVNDVLKRQFVDTQTPLDMYLTIEDIDNWGGWTLHADIPIQEGYKIRVFAHFTDDWKAQLATFKQGDRVRIIGMVSEVAYLNLWNAFTLSVTAKGCTVSR